MDPTRTQAIRQWVQVQGDGSVALAQTGLRPGQWAEVIVVPDCTSDRQQLAADWAQLFQQMRALPGADQLDEQAIAAEVDAVRTAARSGRA